MSVKQCVLRMDQRQHRHLVWARRRFPEALVIDCARLQSIDRDVTEILDGLKKSRTGICCFSGSMRTKTFVLGLSDVDVICASKRWAKLRPSEALQELAMAVGGGDTVGEGPPHISLPLTDGTLLEIVPATLTEKGILSVGAAESNEWHQVDLSGFADRFRSCDIRLGGAVAAAVRCVKWMLSAEVPRARCRGRHIEAMLLEVASHCEPGVSLSELLTKVAEAASSLIRRRFVDATGQFGTVDGYLGDAGDPRRQLCQRVVDAMSRRLISELPLR